MALNDPQWGKRGNEGPPDLDELWRRLNQRLGDALGGKRRGGGGGDTQPPNKRAFGMSLGLIIGVLVSLWLASGFYIVNEGRRGIVLRFGDYNETTLPGLRWHLPYPFEKREIVNISQVQQLEIGYQDTIKTKVLQESLMLTDDENIVDVQFAVQYTIKDPVAYLFNNVTEANDPSIANELVKQAAETAIREVVGKSRMDFVLYEGRSEISARAMQIMQGILDRYEIGIAISNVTMQNAQPPEQVQAAFDDAVKAGQDRERQKNEGQAYANDVIPKARGTAARLLAEANGYRQRVTANAEGEASRFSQVLTEYEKAPKVTRERLYLDAMQQFLSSSTKVMIDQKSGGGNLLYLPLDKLMQMSAESAPPAEPRVAPSTDSGNTSEFIMRRDLRRDRESR